MAWISVHEQVIGMKLRDTAKTIGCSLKETLGILVSLWLWGINNADADGVLIGSDEQDIIGLVSIGISDGISGAKVVKILVEKHWIDYENDTYILHDWSTWQGQWYKALKRRNYDNKRKREAKTKKCEESNPQEFPMDNPQEIPVQPSPSPSPDNIRDIINNISLSQQKKSPPKAPSKKAKVFEEDSVPFRLAKKLKDFVLENNPHARVPKDLNKWAAEFDLMIRRDNRVPKEIYKVMEWSQHDDFWRTNILSPGKLRKQYDQLCMKAKAAKATTGKSKQEIPWA